MSADGPEARTAEREMIAAEQYDEDECDTCERCDQFDDAHDENCPLHPDYDPTPWCAQCGARAKEDCDCGPIAENN